ncbi:hypothetical protein PBI_MAMINIAINA_8 [Mycobacterium phage Maminiaina]|nr:hypothetical protein PBI_MAMINIAINA_8 [Mycobacterium phage Maminiaina]
MAIRLGTASPAFRVGSSTPSRIFLGPDQVWPEYTAVRTDFTTPGAYTYNIPANCLWIDIVLVGAGGGGRGMPNFGTWGQGGRAGSWALATLRRGVNIPWNITQITGVVGDGGAGSAAGFLPADGSPGGNTTATYSGGPVLTAAGGIGGQGGIIDPGGQAVSPASQTLNGQVYTGGGLTSGGASAAGVPGGGGPAAIVTFNNGVKGGVGRASFYAHL